MKNPLSPAQMKALADDIKAAELEIRRNTKDEDEINHFNKIRYLNNAFLVAGLALSPFSGILGLISAICLCIQISTNWAIIAHHILHRAYDKIPNCYNSKDYARNFFNKLVMWCDWFDAGAWEFEHNKRHHMYLNEFLDYKRSDPDLVERNVQMIHNFDTGIKPLNRIIQDIMLFTMVISWRWYYYGCNTYDHFKNEKLKIDRGANWRMVFPFLFTHLTVAERREILINVYIKYLLSRVIYFIPVMILCTQIGIPITTGFYYYTINMMIAEFLSNIHTFLIIVTNHCGSDLYKFSKPVSTHDELIYRAIIGSTNYPQNGFFSDFLHGYLNYQIEHHIFPDKTPYFYEQFAPKVREICQKHNVPYVSGNVWERFLETRKIILGDAEMMLMID